MAPVAAAISPFMSLLNPPIAHDMNDAWKVDHTTVETSPTKLSLQLQRCMAS